MPRRNIPLILLVGIFCAVSAAFSAEDAVVEAIQYRIKGYVYQRQGDYSKAMENYKRAIERDPFYACARNDLGILYEQLGRIEDAEKQYLKALELDPDYASVYSNLAMLYERTGNLETAVYYWEKRSNKGNPSDKWTLHAKEKYEELSEILAGEERFKRGEALKSSLGQITKKETKERKGKKKKEPAQFQTEEEQEIAGASDLAKIIVSEKQRSAKEAGQRQKQEAKAKFDKQKEQEKLQKQQQAEQKRMLEEQKKQQAQQDKLRAQDQARLEKQKQEAEKRIKKEKVKEDKAKQEAKAKFDKQKEQEKLQKEQERQEKLKAKEQARLEKQYEQEQLKKQKAEEKANKQKAKEEKQAKQAEKKAPAKEVTIKQEPKKPEVKTEQKPKKTETKKEEQVKPAIRPQVSQEEAKQEEIRKAAQQKLKEAEQHYKKGKKLYLASRYQEAARELELALVSNPDHAEANRLLRYCQRSTQQGIYRPLESAISTMPKLDSPAQAPQVSQAEEPAPRSLGEGGPVKEAPQDIEKRIAQEVKSQEKASPEMTAADVEKKYQVMGVVAYRSESNDIDKLNEELLKKAKLLGAEEVIQVRYFQHNGFIYGYGTAVKKKK